MTDLIGGNPNTIKQSDIKLRRITSNQKQYFQIIFHNKDEDSSDPEYFIIPNKEGMHNLTTVSHIQFTINPEESVYKISKKIKTSKNKFDSNRYNYQLVKFYPFPKDFILTYSFSLPTSDKQYNIFFNEIETVADDLDCTGVYKHEESVNEAALIDDSKAQYRMSLINSMDDILTKSGDPYEKRNEILSGLQTWVKSAEARTPLKEEVEEVYNKPIYAVIVDIYKKVLEDDSITAGTNNLYGQFLNKMGELIQKYKITKNNSSVSKKSSRQQQQPPQQQQQPYYPQPYYQQPYYQQPLQQPYYQQPQQPYYYPQQQPQQPYYYPQQQQPQQGGFGVNTITANVKNYKSSYTQKYLKYKNKYLALKELKYK